MKVLIVEDDAIQRDVCRNWLLGRGHDVHCAADGPQALRLLEAGSFDVVVLDWLLPVIDGQELLTRIRQRGLAMPILEHNMRCFLNGDLKGMMNVARAAA